MLINKNDLCILAAVGNDSNSSLDHVVLDCGKLVASNGCSLYVLENLNTKDDDFPISNSLPVCTEVDRLMIPSSLLAKAEKNIPSSKTRPVLNNIQLCASEQNAELVCNDLESVQAIKFKNKTTTSHYPEWQAIVKIFNEYEETEEVCLSVDELETLVKVLKKYGEKYFHLKVASPGKMVGVRAGNLNGYIMACKEDE